MSFFMPFSFPHAGLQRAPTRPTPPRPLHCMPATSNIATPTSPSVPNHALELLGQLSQVEEVVFDSQLPASAGLQRAPTRPTPLRPLHCLLATSNIATPTSPSVINHALELQGQLSQGEDVVFDSQLPASADFSSAETSAPQATMVDRASPSVLPPERATSSSNKRRRNNHVEQTDGAGEKYASRRFHWDNRKTIVLIEAKKAHDDDKFQAGVAGKSKTMEQQWRSIAATCVSKGVLVDWKSAHDKWMRLSKIHKEIADWERNIPSGRSSYWTMTFTERQIEGRFSHNFDKDLFDVMERHFGYDPAVDPTATVVDSNNDNWSNRGRVTTPSSNDAPSAGEEPPPFEQTASNGGVPLKKTRKRMHSYDVGLKDATRDMTKVFEAHEEGRDRRHAQMMTFEEQNAQTGKEIATGINMMAMALAKIADKM